MATLRKVKALATKLGATVDVDRSCGYHELTVEAPKGHRWTTDELHMFVDCVAQPWKPDYADMLDRMEQGIEVCPDPACEWCHPELYE